MIEEFDHLPIVAFSLFAGCRWLLITREGKICTSVKVRRRGKTGCERHCRAVQVTRARAGQEQGAHASQRSCQLARCRVVIAAEKIKPDSEPSEKLAWPVFNATRGLDCSHQQLVRSTRDRIQSEGAYFDIACGCAHCGIGAQLDSVNSQLIAHLSISGRCPYRP